MGILDVRSVFFLLASLAVLAAGPAPAREADRATLTTMQGDTPIVIDEFSRGPDGLTVSTDSVGRARFQIEAKVADDEAISEARIRVWPAGQSEPQMDRTVKLIGEYIFWGDTGGEPATMKVPVDTLVYIPPSATAVEQAVRYALAVRGDRDTVPLKIWTPYQAAEVLDAEVRFPESGIAELEIFDATFTLSIDSEGNILEGHVEPQGTVIVRE